MKRILSLLILLMVGICFYSTPALAVSVGAELLLLVDTSGSINSSEYALQKGGYVAAFQNPTIQAAIAARAGGIAVAYAEWSGSAQQVPAVGWTHLTNATDANNFAAAIAGVTRSFSGLTAPGSAINWGVPLFSSNNFEGGSMAIDVSGDGSQNDGANTAAAAAAALLAGIQVNGLPILAEESGLQAWYQNNIVTPGGGFLIVAQDFASFEAAVTDKIGREITPAPIPEPATMILLGSGLIGLAGLARRKFQKKQL